MSILDILWDLFRAPAPIPIPSKTIIQGTRVIEILKPYTDNIWSSDSYYNTVNKKIIQDFLLKNPVNGRKYLVESHDCDDFSFELMGNVSDWSSDILFGIVWGNNANGDAHAWNFFIDDKEKLWFVEPQTDQIFEPTKEKIWIFIF